MTRIDDIEERLNSQFVKDLAYYGCDGVGEYRRCADASDFLEEAVKVATDLISFVREVEKLHRPLTIGRYATCSTCRDLFGALVPWPCRTHQSLGRLNGGEVS